MGDALKGGVTWGTLFKETPFIALGTRAVADALVVPDPDAAGEPPAAHSGVPAADLSGVRGLRDGRAAAHRRGLGSQHRRAGQDGLVAPDLAAAAEGGGAACGDGTLA